MVATVWSSVARPVITVTVLLIILLLAIRRKTLGRDLKLTVPRVLL